MSIRLALIGCGEHSELGHAIPLARYAAAHCGVITLAAACDLRGERAELFCKKYSFARAYEDAAERLAREQIDVCIGVVAVGRISEAGVNRLAVSAVGVHASPVGDVGAG